MDTQLHIGRDTMKVICLKAFYRSNTGVCTSVSARRVCSSSFHDLCVLHIQGCDFIGR